MARIQILKDSTTGTVSASFSRRPASCVVEVFDPGGNEIVASTPATLGASTTVLHDSGFGQDDRRVVRLASVADLEFRGTYLAINAEQQREAVQLLSVPPDNTDTVAYTTAGNYTADSGTLVSGGAATLQEEMPPDGLLLARFTSDADADFSGGSATATVVNATVSGGKLDLTGGTKKYITYPSSGNVGLNVGCIRFKYTPNYSGAPPAQYWIFCDMNTSANDEFQFAHKTNGELHIKVREAGAFFINTNFGTAWSPTAGQEYEFELNYDFTGGATRLFIDGVQKWITITNTGTRAAHTKFIVGAEWSLSTNSDGKIDDLTLFDAPQHTADYTPTGQNTWYPTTDDLKVDTTDAVQVSPSRITAWLTLGAVSTIPSGADARVMFSNDGRTSWLTWDGSAWVAPASATTRADATSLTDASTNFASLPVGDNDLLDVRLFLYTSDSSVAPSIDSFAIVSDRGDCSTAQMLEFSYVTGDTFESSEVTHTLTASETDDLGRTFRARFTATMADSSVEVRDVLFDVVNHVLEAPITAANLHLYDPTLDQLTVGSGRGTNWADMLDRAFDLVYQDLVTQGLKPDLYIDEDRLSQLQLYKLKAQLAEDGLKVGLEEYPFQAAKHFTARYKEELLAAVSASGWYDADDNLSPGSGGETKPARRGRTL